MIKAAKVVAFFAGLVFFLLVVVPPVAVWLAETELMKDSEALQDLIEQTEATRESWARLLVSLRG